MSDEHKQFISDEELKRIRKRKLAQFVASREKNDKMPAKPVHVSDADFNDVVKKNRFALIDFWAAWCGPCQALAPVIEELACDYDGKVFVGKLDVDENPKTAESFQVYSIPTLLLMKDGCEVDRIVGCVPKKQIEAHLKKNLV